MGNGMQDSGLGLPQAPKPSPLHEDPKAKAAMVAVAAVIVLLVVLGAVFLAGRASVDTSSADGGQVLSDNVQNGPRNGIVTGVYENEICFTMMSYMLGGRNDDHTSCAPNSTVKNLGQEYRVGAVFAPSIDPVEGLVLSVTAFEVAGSDSGLLLHLPVQQDEPIPTPTIEPTVPAPSLPNSGSDGS